jgi:hypothetical protein
MVRAKFRCNSITEYDYQTSAKLNAVHSNEGENKDFTKATPNGSLDISIDKDVPASTFFKVGKLYYLDFSEAPEK